MRDLRMTTQQEELFNKNIKFAYMMASKWCKEPNMTYTYDELCSYALEALVLAAKSYDPEKNDKFLSYASVVLGNIKKRQMQKSRKFSKEIPVEDKDLEVDGYQTDDNIFELQSQIESYLSYCDDINKYIFAEAILKKRNINDIARELNVSHQTVYTRMRNIKDELENFIMQ